MEDYYIINSKLFGDGEENEIFRYSLGDYLAIATSDKTILYIGSEVLKSHHTGFTDDEIFAPLIVMTDIKNEMKKCQIWQIRTNVVWLYCVEEEK